MIAPFTTIDQGDGSRVAEPRRAIVRDDGEWKALWAVHAGPDAATPAVDFTSRMVAAVFAGERPTPGYEVAITAARRHGTALALVVEEHTPEPGMVAAQMLVTPFHIVSLPRYDGDVQFSTDAIAPPRARRTHHRSRSARSSTGLEPNTAAALAYLAGPFSGVLVLLAERTNEFVRFHALQAIVGLGGLGLLAVLLLVGAFAALLVSPAGFTVMYWLAFITGGLWLIVWAACLVQAFTGRSWKLPLAGSFAERRATLKP